MGTRRGWATLVVAIGFGLGTVVSAAAQAREVLLSRTYVRGSGKAVTETTSFTVCDVAGQFWLAMMNGTAGQPAVSQGTIKVNGREVVTKTDFRRGGSLERSLTGIAATNTLAVTLGGAAGGSIQVIGLAVQDCGVRITAPAPGSVLTGFTVLVRGFVPPWSDIGVTVNGAPAFVEGVQFGAVVSLDPEVTSLTATATDSTGATLGGQTIAVTVQPSAPATALRLNVEPPGGTAPLTVKFSLSGLSGVAQVALDLEGDGTVEFRGPSLEGQSFTYSRAGVYTPTVQVTDTQGAIHTESTIIQVFDVAALNGRLQSLWTELKDALRVGDIGRAVQLIHSEARDAYQTQFSSFRPAILTNIDRYMTTIQFVEVGPGGAQYEMLRQRDGQTLSFSVWFQLDEDGHWRIVQY